MVTAMARVDDQATLAAAAADLASEGARRFDAAFRFGAGLFSILLMLLAWELFARSGKVTPFMLPRFSVVLAYIYKDATSGVLWINLGTHDVSRPDRFCHRHDLRHRACDGDGTLKDRAMVF